MRLKDKVAIVTGGGVGIGKAYAQGLAKEGARVVVADIQDAEAQKVAADINAAGGEAIAVAVDVTSPEKTQAMAAAALKAYSRIDILVNNAGTLARVGIEETTDAIWERDINTTLRGSFYCIQAVLPYMKSRGHGKIVNISSISGKIGGVASRATGSDKGRSGPAYAAAKGGLLALTKWVAKDVGRHGIYVNAVAPSGVESDMTKGFDYGIENYPIARMGQPEDIAQAVVFLASQASNYITGAILDVNGGIV